MAYNNNFDKLVYITNLLEKYNIEYWIDSGTLLGIMRDGKLLPNDKDIDISIWEEGLSKIDPFLKEVANSDYTITKNAYRGNVFLYSLIPNNNYDNQIIIDLKIFAKSGSMIYCPSVVYREIKYKQGTLPYRLVVLVNKLIYRMRLNKHIQQYLREDRFPLSIVYRVATWYAPSEYFKSFIRHPEYSFYIPEKWREYLVFRYGDWKKPVKKWDHRTDDGGYANKTPNELLYGKQ